MNGRRDAKRLEELRSMSRKELIMNIAVFAGFIIVCMGGGGAIGAITADGFGDYSPW